MMPVYQASDSENACDFFFRFFLFSIRPTDPISGNAFDDKQNKKKKGMALAERSLMSPLAGMKHTYVRLAA